MGLGLSLSGLCQAMVSPPLLRNRSLCSDWREGRACAYCLGSCGNGEWQLHSQRRPHQPSRRTLSQTVPVLLGTGAESSWLSCTDSFSQHGESEGQVIPFPWTLSGHRGEEGRKGKQAPAVLGTACSQGAPSRCLWRGLLRLGNADALQWGFH